MADIILDLYDEDVTVTIQDPEEISLEIQDPETISINVTDNGSKGDPGDPGLNWLGDWDSLVNYVAKDGVYYQGSSFVCKLGNNNQAPFEGSSYWDIAAKKGQGSTPKGAYNAGTGYVVDDIVEYDGSSYNCISPTTGNAPPNPTYWELFVSKGDPGPAGTGVTWRGDWASGDNYAVNDAVFNNGSAFVCNTAHTNEEPPDPSYWDPFASGLRFRGDWSGVIDYNLGDLARSSGTVYICVLGHTNQAPPNLTYWEVFSEQGLQGPAGNDGDDGYSVLEGAGAPANGLGIDGDHYIDTTNRILYVGKASGDWANATQIQLSPSPNGTRVTVGTNSQNPNSATPVAITFKGSYAYKDAGVNHSTSINSERFSPETGKGGRYTFIAFINYNSPSAPRINLHLYIRKNGTTDLDGDGDSFAGYSRNSGGSETSTCFLIWSGDLLDTDYIELMSEQGDTAGSVSIISTSFAEFNQKTLLENQAGGGGFGWGAWQDLTMNTANTWNDSHNNAQYRISDDGENVELRGAVQRTGSIASQCATLPAGYRPPTGFNHPAFITANKSTLGTVYTWILPTGEIWQTGYSVNNILELGGIVFQTSRT